MIHKLIKSISNSNHITVITGAGISTSAGIPDFRGPNGLYSMKNIDTDKIFDINYFHKNPSYFYSIISEFWLNCLTTRPTKAHDFFVKLDNIGKLNVLITQNIDGLHAKAGSKNIIRAHGSFDKMHCIKCGLSLKTDNLIIDKISKKIIPYCNKCGGVLKPDVVFFGEPIHGIDIAIEKLKNTDLLLAVGTSLMVYPIASLPNYIANNCKFIIINKGATAYDSICSFKIEGDIDQTFKYLDKYI